MTVSTDSHRRTARRTAVVPTWVIACAIGLFSAASILAVHQYRYGIGDHWSTLPILNYYVNPDLYPTDYFQAVRPYYYTVLWWGLAGISTSTGIGVPILMFVGQCAAVLASFVGLYYVAMVLFEDRRTALVALLLFLLATKGPLAGGCTLEGIFTTRSAALPFLLFAMGLFLKQKYVASYLLQGVAFLIHPLTAFYLIFLLGFGLLAAWREVGIRKMILCGGVLLAVSSPILIWKAMYSPDSLHAFHAPAEWMRVHRLRSGPAVFPSMWPLDDYFRTALLGLVFVVGWKHRPVGHRHRTLVAATVGILVLFALGAVFSEVKPAPLLMQLQLLRSSLFLMLFAILYFAHLFVTELRRPGSVYDKMLVAFASVGVLYGGMAGSWQIAALGFLVMAVALVLGHGIGERPLQSGPLAVGTLGLAGVLSLGAFVQRGGLPPIQDASEAAWLDVQEWARDHTDLADVFIVPPHLSGFRNQSQRGIYGSWKDGTMGFWDADFALEWLRRMEMLDVAKTKRSYRAKIEAYLALREADFQRVAADVADQPGGVYLVVTSRHDRLRFSQVYENERYCVYRIPE